MRSENRRRWARIAVVLASCLLALGAVEVTLRLEVYRESRAASQLLAAERTEPAERQRPAWKGREHGAYLNEIIRPHPNPRLVYELRPNQRDVLFRGGWITTNAACFRGRDYSLEAGARTVRILGIGDSVMFGWGVSDGEEYLARIEERLNRERPQVNWEVLNLAVPGYNAVNSVETLVVKGLAYQPDLVLFGLVSNDLGVPFFLIAEERFKTLRSSLLVDRILKRLRIVRWNRPRLDQASDLGIGFQIEPERIPTKYQHLAGEAPFRAALEQLRNHTEGAGALCAILTNEPHLALKRVLPAARTSGMPLLQMIGSVRARAQEEGLSRDELRLRVEDPHPSALAHGFLADTIFERFEEAGVWAQLQARARNRAAESDPLGPGER